jgi:hypothetical protein
MISPSLDLRAEQVEQSSKKSKKISHLKIRETHRHVAVTSGKGNKTFYSKTACSSCK